MSGKIRAKQLHEDISGLVISYARGTFWSKGEILDYSGIFSGIRDSGFMVRDRVELPSGQSGVYFDFSDFQFEQIPFFNYSLIAPSEASDFFVSHASNVDNSGARINLSSPINNTGYYLDILFGVDRNIFYIEEAQPVSDSRSFISGLTSGLSTEWIEFSPYFSSSPVINTTLQVPNGSPQYYFNYISGASLSGFWSSLSGPIEGSGFFLHVRAETIQ
jgi:hypothetical protein